MSEHTGRFPIKHVLGFILSIALTVLAAWAALASDLPTVWVIWAIMILAVIQAGIQLFMFMHMTERESGGGHIPWNMMFHGFFLAAIVVAGSLFVMYSGHGTAGHGGDHGGDQKQHEQHDQHGQHGNH